MASWAIRSDLLLSRPFQRRLAVLRSVGPLKRSTTPAILSLSSSSTGIGISNRPFPRVFSNPALVSCFRRDVKVLVSESEASQGGSPSAKSEEEELEKQLKNPLKVDSPSAKSEEEELEKQLKNPLKVDLSVSVHELSKVAVTINEEFGPYLGGTLEGKILSCIANLVSMRWLGKFSPRVYKLLEDTSAFGIFGLSGHYGKHGHIYHTQNGME